MPFKPISASGKPLNPAKTQARWRANKPKKEQAKHDAKRRSKRIEVTKPLNIHKLAIADAGPAYLASGTVNAVITDPPYAEADVPLYGDLGRFAMRVLKPGGWCLAMVGDLYLARIMSLMTASGLVDRGYIAIGFPGGGHSRIGATKTFQAVKLVLVMQKPPTCQPPEWGPNFLTAPMNGHDKSLHQWQQSLPIFERLIERFTVPGDVVVDPFAGSGITLLAVQKLMRCGWGCDDGSADHL